MTTVESHRVTTKEITVNYFPPEELHENYDKSKKRKKNYSLKINFMMNFNIF